MSETRVLKQHSELDELGTPAERLQAYRYAGQLVDEALESPVARAGLYLAMSQVAELEGHEVAVGRLRATLRAGHAGKKRAAAALERQLRWFALQNGGNPR